MGRTQAPARSDRTTAAAEGGRGSRDSPVSAQLVQGGRPGLGGRLGQLPSSVAWGSCGQDAHSGPVTIRGG